MSNFSKGDGSKIAIKFTEDLIGNVSGKPEDVTGVGWNRSVFEKSKNNTLRTNGWMFSPKEDMKITDLMIFSDIATLVVMHVWRVEDKVKLIQHTFTSEANTWSLSPLNTPLKLEAGSEYIISSNNPVGEGYMYSSTVTAAERLDFSSHINMIDTYRIDSQNTFPTTKLAGTYTNSVGFAYEIEGIGNEIAFSIEGKERRYIGGNLIDVNYKVDNVKIHPTIEKAILLTMDPLKRFNNVEGNLIVKYDATKGHLTGEGGMVESFEYSFIPSDLVQKHNPSAFEKIIVKHKIDTAFIRVDYNNRYGEENIAVKPSISINFINVNEINP